MREIISGAIREAIRDALIIALDTAPIVALITALTHLIDGRVVAILVQKEDAHIARAHLGQIEQPEPLRLILRGGSRIRLVHHLDSRDVDAKRGGEIRSQAAHQRLDHLGSVCGDTKPLGQRAHLRKEAIRRTQMHSSAFRAARPTRVPSASIHTHIHSHSHSQTAPYRQRAFGRRRVTGHLDEQRRSCKELFATQ